MPNLVARKLRKTMTPHEIKLWVNLKQLEGFHFRRQTPIGPYIVDFSEKTQKLIIECDGSQHNEESNIAKDQIRDAYLTAKGYKVLRFWNNEIDSNMSGIIESILLRASGEGGSP
jgi:very-short-patch-repair endonuclease